ncbi:MAG: HAMP domain-containing histidine kinase [Paracoccaceae bacterium]|nr:HAMP domain-containing histidine kinase [Paracoccaceae bacterium]MDE3237515.1 HAMP domain-containing histidine kinase [Paracoccaceae bacterium]
MRRWSLHFRLFVAGAASVIAALALAAMGLSLLFNAHVERRAVADLSIQLDQVLAGLALDPKGALTLPEPPSDPRFRQPLGGLYWQVQGKDFTLRSRSLWDYTLPLPTGDATDGTVHVHDLPGPDGGKLLTLERHVILPPRLGDRSVMIAVAMNRSELVAEGRSFVTDMTPYLGLLAAFLIVAGWLQVAVGLRPLATVGARVAAIRSGESARLGADFPVEVRPLASEVDALIAAREDDVIRARTRAGDLAHGLKTPLQALYGEAGRLRDHGEDASASAIEQIADMMHRHVDRELTRARIAATAPAAHSDLAAVMGRVLSVVRRTPEGKRIDWDVRIPEGLSARIDADDLTEALGALTENAARHARSRVSVHTLRLADGLRLTLADDGPGIPPDRLADLMRRGVRLDSEGPGHGLGLTIASEILTAAGGILELENRTSGPGLEVRITLPGAAQQTRSV